MKTLPVSLPKDEIISFCQQWKITEFSVFGSILRDDFRPDSDIDVLVVFAPESRWGLLALSRMRRELAKILGREVDLVSKRAIEQSYNWIRRKEILETAQVFYVAR